ncbi:hypothetical protein DM860_000245 [Cuscuta australis]|uniref:FBD domain-containing protein n=1 Tax=Cuscuta australis TaxID=267555 RepID=A0A328CZ03_9ASTE|nr:hypothetical protein DM860_000245 [Cuscuta australis]
MNLQVLYLYEFSFSEEGALTTFIQLLKKCPTLRLLKFLSRDKTRFAYAREASPRMLEDSSGRLNGQDLCKLQTVEIGPFRGSRQEMFFVKAIISNSPALEKLVIMEANDIGALAAFKFPRELLCVPRASTKAKIVFKDTKPTVTSLVR